MHHLPSLSYHHRQHDTHIWSYTFLDACTPLLVVSKDGQIGFTTRSPRRPEAKSRYLMFPDVSAGTAYGQPIVFHDSKLPRPESYPAASTSFSRSTIPAQEQADHGVVALSISTIGLGQGTLARYLVFFLREALARLFRQELSLAGDGEGEGDGDDLDWAAWGPAISRWFISPSFDQWRCSVHGYRFVTLVTRMEASLDISSSFPFILPDDALDSPQHLLVFDFNPYRLRRQHCSSTTIFSNAVVIAPSDATFHDLEERFEGDVTGHLACRITLMQEPADYAALAACEDTVIGIQVR